MLDQSLRTAVFVLDRQGHSRRSIAKALGVSRGAVNRVLAQGAMEVPKLERTEKAEEYREQILELYTRCGGNLVRVHEELLAAGAVISYQALTGFCRRHQIGKKPRRPSGHYEFASGQEMQHDTSPHDVVVGGVKRRLQTASLVLCFSRMIFIQLFLRFTRFECKLFLTQAFEYFGGLCRDCMIDNTHVVVLRGTGREMRPVPEMEAFAERFGFTFRAHELGDKNRSAQVESHFNYVERNFVRGGYTFSSIEDLNQQARAWCDKANAKFSRNLHASRRELFAAERPHLVSLPIWVPPVYRLHHRIVDVEGYISVDGNRYSAPYKLMGRRLEVREGRDRVELFDGPRQVASHPRLYEPGGSRSTQPEHRPPRGEGRSKRGPSAEEERVLALEPRLGGFVTAIKGKTCGQAVKPLRRLLRFLDDYPREPLLDATTTALTYGMFDLDRLERMVLRRVADQFFHLKGSGKGPPS